MKKDKRFSIAENMNKHPAFRQSRNYQRRTSKKGRKKGKPHRKKRTAEIPCESGEEKFKVNNSLGTEKMQKGSKRKKRS